MVVGEEMFGLGYFFVYVVGEEVDEVFDCDFVVVVVDFDVVVVEVDGVVGVGVDCVWEGVVWVVGYVVGEY